MANYDYKWIRETILNSKFYSEYAYKHTWISGESTEVHPITIYPENTLKEIEINIQLDGRKTKGRYAAFRRVLNTLRKRYPKMVAWFNKMDGSCPDYYEILVWQKEYEPKKKRGL